jgi:lipopolysaccharide biosynthesis glycosyltransferase
MANINIAITLDKNYVQHTAVMIYSLLNHNKDNNICLYIISDGGVSQTDWDKLEKVYKNSTLKVEKILVDVARFANYKLSAHATPANYYRIQMAELLPAHIDKVLYLDVDIVVRHDLSELYNLNIDDYLIAAIEDPDNPLKVELGIAKNEPYFNSGVLLINLAAWRREKLHDKLSDFILNNAAIIRYWDQDAFNVICKGKWKPLHPRYNTQTEMYFLKTDAITYTLVNIKEATADPVILHFTGRTKPWEYMNWHPKKGEYYKCLKKTPWKNFKPADKTIVNILRQNKLMPKFLEKLLQNR